MLRCCFHYVWITIIAITLVTSAWDMSRMNICDEAQKEQDMPCHPPHAKQSQVMAKCCQDAFCHTCFVSPLDMVAMHVLLLPTFMYQTIDGDRVIAWRHEISALERPPKILG